MQDFISPQLDDQTQLSEVKPEAEHQVKKEFLQMLVENSFDLIALIDESGRYIDVAESEQNASKGKKDSLLGYQPSDFIGKASFEFFHPDDLSKVMEQFQTLFTTNKKLHVPPYRFRDASGKWRWMEAIVTNQLDHPDIRAIVVSCRDVTHRVEMEARLKELMTLKALMEGEEKERNRIASDLHDSVANFIAAAKMQLTALAESVQEVQKKQEFLQSLDLLDTAAAQVRSTSHNLKQELLIEYGLDEALRRYCGSLTSSKIAVEYVCVGTIRRFSEAFELALYRNAQELIGNAIKHSQASSVLVQLSFQEKLLGLTIEDNGKGFDVHQPTNGSGLKSVQKRVNAMNGRIEFQSVKEEGTCIYIEFEL